MMTNPSKGDSDSSATIGKLFVALLARQAWQELAACLDEAVQFRALIPSGLRTADDRASAASYFQKWFGDADQLILSTSLVQPMHDRLHITYRFSAHEDQWYIVEQQLYCIVQDGHLKQINLLCSGFRPEVNQSLA
jgi:hypothetical protein